MTAPHPGVSLSPSRALTGRAASGRLMAVSDRLMAESDRLTVDVGRALQPGHGTHALSTRLRRYLLDNPGLLAAGLSRRAR